MTAQTKIQRADQLETPVLLMACPENLEELATPERQAEARKIYTRPGIVVIDNVIGEPNLSSLREGMAGERRKFKEKFNHGLPTSENFTRAYNEAGARITELTRVLFGYDLPEVSAKSYRPMITEDEPLHYDTYEVECGTISLMSVLNFDVNPRVWKVGPSFREICRDSRQAVEEILKNKKPWESPSVPLRSAGLRGIGPLRAGTPLHHIEFAPGAVWYANPKTISHKIDYGAGAFFDQWDIKVPNCECQACVIEKLGVTVPHLRSSAAAASA